MALYFITHSLSFLAILTTRATYKASSL